MKKILAQFIFTGGIFLLLFITACKISQQTTTQSSPRTVQTSASKGNEGLDSANIERNFIDGCKYVAIGDYQKAISAFKEVLKLDPNNAPSFHELAKIYYESGQVNDALNYAKRSVEITPENIYFELLYADILTYATYYDDAAATYRKIISLDKKNADAYYQLAYIYEKQKNYEAALKVFDEVIAEIGVDEPILLEVERIYIQLNQPDKAIETLIQLHKMNPEAPQYLYMLTEAYELTGQVEQANKTFEELLEMDPNNPDLQFKRADLMRHTGNMHGYFETIRAAFLNPNGNIDKKIFYLVPYIDSIDKKNFALKDSVLEWTNLLVRTHPEDAKSYAMRGDFLYYVSELSEARENYIQSTAIRADVYDVWVKLFYIDSDLRKYDSLKRTTNDAMELYPNQPLTYYFSGVALKGLMDYEGALKVLKRGLPLAVSNTDLRADMYTAMGDCYNELENYPESDRSFENSLMLNPDNPFALNNYAYYLSLRKENLDKAEDMSKRSIELAPNEASLEDTYGWILFQNEKFNDAKKWLEKAMQHGGDKSGVILEHYGDVLYHLGDEDKAVEYWQKAKQAGGASDLIDKKISDKKYYE